MKIKTILRRMDNCDEFDRAVNEALNDGWTLKKRKVLQQGQPKTAKIQFCSMLYAELVKE